MILIPSLDQFLARNNIFSVLSCLKMECSSSSRDSSSTPPFIENPSDENSNDSSVRDSYQEGIHPSEGHLSEEEDVDEGVELKNQELRSPKFAEEEDDALSSIINRSRQEDENEDQSEDEPEIEPALEIEPDDEPENEPENEPQPQTIFQPPILPKSETEIPSTDSVYQRRKKVKLLLL